MLEEYMMTDCPVIEKVMGVEVIMRIVKEAHC